MNKFAILSILLIASFQSFSQKDNLQTKFNSIIAEADSLYKYDVWIKSLWKSYKYMKKTNTIEITKL